MNWQKKYSRKINIHALCFIAVIILMSHTAAFGAAAAPPSTRVGIASDKFDGVVQVAAAFEVSRWQFLRAHHIEISVGPISTSDGNAAFVSIGPVWRTPLVNDRFFVDVGISPTLFSASRYGQRDLGGHFHFTSFLSAGMRLGRRSALALRIQHTSNGGIRGTNPGMDMLGMEFSVSFSD